MEDSLNNTIKWAMSDIQGSGSITLDRQRPYDGQTHTDGGQRGKQEVKGLTMRDVADCIVRGFLACGGIERECPIRDDIYSVDLDEIDPGAVIQATVCNIEKLMGIYPNVPGMDKEL